MPPTQRPRRATTSGYACGEETRRRLIDVAIRLFGEKGYEGASTRDIASQAGVNAPALQYHFNSKEGLYRACAEHLANMAAAHFAPSLTAAEAVLAQPDAPKDALVDAFLALQDAIADHLLLNDEAQHRRLFIAQEQAGHGVTQEPLERPIKAHMTRVGAALVSRLSGLPPDDPQTLLRLMTAHGQLMVFHVVPRSALQSLGWERLDGERLTQLKQVVRAQTRALIDSWCQPA